jgi:hypothetical protein
MWSQFLKQEKAELIKAKMTGSSIEAIAKAAGSTVLQATLWKTNVNCHRKLLEMHFLGK